MWYPGDTYIIKPAFYIEPAKKYILIFFSIC